LNVRADGIIYKYFISNVVYCFLYTNQIKVHALIDQSAMVYCASKIMEKLHSNQLFYKSNRPQVSMVYIHDKPLGMLEEHSTNL